MTATPNSIEFEVRSALNTIKVILRERKMTLKTLSGRMGLSESGLKKMLNASDISLSRISQICAELNLTMADLFKSQADDSYYDVSFTEDQQKFFLQNFLFFQFYWLLVYERQPLMEVQKILGVGEEKKMKILFKLDQFGLLKLHAEGRVEVPDPTRIHWSWKGPLVAYLFREWPRKLIDQILKSPKKNQSFIIRYLQMRPETYDRFLLKLQQVEDEIVKEAIREMKTIKKGLVPCRWVSAMDSESFHTPLETPAKS